MTATARLLLTVYACVQELVSSPPAASPAKEPQPAVDTAAEIASLQDDVKGLTEELAAAREAASSAEAAAASAAGQHVSQLKAVHQALA